MADPSLRDYAGHCANYLIALDRAVKAGGGKTVVAGNQAVADQPEIDALGHPCFRLSCDETPGNLPRAASNAEHRRTMLDEHARSIAQDLRILDGRLGFRQSDILLINSLRQWQLGGIAQWLAGLDPDRVPSVVLILHYTPFPQPGQMGPEASEYKAALLAIRSLEAARRPLLFTDSEVLQEQFQSLTDMQIDLLPIPHCEAAPPEPANAGKQHGLQAVFLGQARRNKGFGLLEEAVDHAFSQLAPGALQFRFQAVDPDFSPQEWHARCQRLRTLGVDLIEQALGDREYDALLRGADIVLLPYLRSHYDSQTSGVLAEALALGKPVIVPKDTWMAEQVAGHGNAELFESGDAATLGAAIVAIADDYARYRHAAQVRARDWVKFHNAGTFIETITRRIGANPDRNFTHVEPS